MATSNVPVSSPLVRCDDTCHEMEVLLLKAFGIVELMNVSGNPHQNAAWAASDMLRETMDLRDALQTQLREVRAEADHD